MQATLSANNSISSKYSIPLLLALIVAGLAGNYFKFEIFLNVDFLFGSIFAFLALQFFGLARGIPAAAIIASYTYILWNHPYAIVIITAEVAFVGWLMLRSKIGMVLADTLYWLVIGMPLAYIFYHAVMHVPLSHTYIVMSKQAVNGIFNALVARLIFTGFGLRSRSSLISYHDIVYNLLAFFVLCPALIMLAVGSRTDFAETDRQIRNSLIQESGRVSLRLKTWLFNRKSAIFNLAEMAVSKTPKQMQSYLEQTKKSDVNFLRVGLLGRDASVTAFFPLLDEQGKSNIGKNYADRPFIPTLKKNLTPMLSEVVMGRIGNPKPVVSILAPVVISGGYGGYVIGVLGLQQLEEYLDKSADENALLFSLLDKNGNVIMTNRTDQKVMTPFVREKGTINRLDKGISQWVPVLPDNISIMERWRRSFYIEETTIGDLSEWKLILEQPVAPYQKRLYDQYTGKLTLLFLILLVALALAEFFSRKIVVTLGHLASITHELPVRLADCKEVVWPESGIIETNDLIYNFREMADSLATQFYEIQQINESLEQRVEERTNQLSNITQELSIILQNAPVGITKIIDMKQVWVNRKIEELFLYSKKEMESETTRKLFTSDEAYRKLAQETYLVLSQGLIYESVQEMVRKDGVHIFIRLIGKALEPQNISMGTIWLLEDITERKQSEEKLRKSEELYHSLVETSQDLIWQCDTEGRYTYLNLAWEHVFGYELKEMLGKKFGDFQTPENAARDLIEFNRLMEGNSVTGFETTHIGKSGNEIHLVFNALFMCDENGEIVGASGTAYDITNRRRAEDELRDAKAAAETSSIAKSRFLANMSHEIRTPMNSIIGLIELLLGTDLSKEQRRYAEFVKQSGRNLVQLLSDILDLSKIESHKIELELREFDLQAEMTGTIKLLSLHAEEKGLLLESSIDADVPLLLKGDTGRLRQIITNLVGNAIKFTAKGSVSLHIRKDAEDRQQATLHFQVRDTGIGIASEKLGEIFNPFTQADGSTTRKFGGTGLGLTISRQLAELMGGTIGVESLEGEGSTFWFTALFEKQAVAPSIDGRGQAAGLKGLEAGEDLASVESAGIPPTLPISFSSQKVRKRGDEYSTKSAAAIRLLLAEDDLTNQLVTCSILEKSGFQVDVANDGREALNFLEKNDYDLVLMDCMMPVLNGYDATAAIRDQSSKVRNHALPVIALTANAMSEARNDCLSAGMDDYLSKPIEAAELLAMLEKWVPFDSVHTMVQDKTYRKTVSDEDAKCSPQMIEIFNRDEFVRRNLGDLELSCDVATIFINNASEYIESIRKAAATRDTVALRQSAHKLKGAAANLALPSLSETARKIESDAKSGDLDKVLELLPELVQRFEQTVEAIRESLITKQGRA
ncbi:MAG: ATP-binding protein [Desulfuromonadaceae bacterium]|nr:ATP-binding protein [Desulfuromonadaceae bacterium]